MFVFNNVDDLGMGIGAFHVVIGAGLAFLCVYTGMQVLLSSLLSSSSLMTVVRLNCGGLIINMQFSEIDIEDRSSLIDSLDGDNVVVVDDKYTCLDCSKREL